MSSLELRPPKSISIKEIGGINFKKQQLLSYDLLDPWVKHCVNESHINKTLKECTMFFLTCLYVCACATEHAMWPRIILWNGRIDEKNTFFWGTFDDPFFHCFHRIVSVFAWRWKMLYPVENSKASDAKRKRNKTIFIVAKCVDHSKNAIFKKVEKVISYTKKWIFALKGQG